MRRTQFSGTKKGRKGENHRNTIGKLWFHGIESTVLYLRLKGDAFGLGSLIFVDVFFFFGLFDRFGRVFEGDGSMDCLKIFGKGFGSEMKRVPAAFLLKQFVEQIFGCLPWFR